MTTAGNQFLRNLVSAIYGGATAVGSIVGVLLLFSTVLALILIVWDMVMPSPTPEEAARLNLAARLNSQVNSQASIADKQKLCFAARVCKKYSEARLDCATAGNFKTCLRIKMGDDAYAFASMCSGGDIGAAAAALSPETPNALECFFLNFR